MTVSNSRNGQSSNEFITTLRMLSQSRSVAGAATLIIEAESPPVQLITPAAAATARLDLSAPSGRVWFIRNVPGVGDLTVQDSNLVTIATLASGSSGMFTKVGAAFSVSSVGLAATQAAITSLTDNTGGTPSDTLADVPATYTEATLANQLASLAAKTNAILTALRNAKIIA